jgi:biotin carboxyl carrier protein
MKMLRITLEGKTYEVGVEVLQDPAHGAPHAAAPLATASAPVPSIPAAVSPAVPAAEGCRTVTGPMAGQVFKCLVKPGDVVTLNQVVVVLDAMKMETPVVSPFAGTVRAVLVKEGDAVDEGHALVQIETAG